MLNSIGALARRRLLDATLSSKSTADHAGSTPLAALDIEQALALAWPGGCAVETVAITGSTNEDLVARARTRQSPQCLLRAADFQTGGRGRQQRSWRAAPGDALLFSVAVPMVVVPATLSAVTLACGVALGESLAKHGVAVQLKWPNDIRVNGHKLGGILTELVMDRTGRYTLVIGAGINLRLDDAARRAIEQPVIALDQLLPASIDRRREPWIGQFGGEVIAAAHHFLREGFEPFFARFNRLLEARGEIVDVVDGNRQTLSGRLVEVDRLGRLVIESGGVNHRVSVGDVSVRQ
ncbi:MAG TPA: biotin--[acetyl-CoA-carboxylase] ligase [Burkholderiaceae bacterium]|nr:biotin--[acetyl-CoA-carboxylase] ligase [Burkholderiaceae bacterium]